jgi:FkbM family methyltransferase
LLLELFAMKLEKVSPLFVLPILAGLFMLASCRSGNQACNCPPSRFESGAYFSQLYEDYVLDYVFRNQKMGFYVDVGANDPNHDSVTRIFYERGWRGVNIEPNADEFKKIIQARPRDSNYNVGISDTEGTLPFYQAAGGEDALSTFDKANAETLSKKRGTTFKEIPIPVTTLTKILRQAALPEISFVSIDVEGFEKQVLRGIDFKEFRPAVFCIEATEPTTEVPSYQAWEELLVENNYVFAMFDGLNRYYVHKDHISSLLPRFVFIDMCVKKSKLKRQIRLNGYNPW